MKLLKCDCCEKIEPLTKDCSTVCMFRDYKDIKLDLCINCENKLECIISDFTSNKENKELIWNAIKDIPQVVKEDDK